mgnify:CR=1 FL=1
MDINTMLKIVESNAVLQTGLGMYGAGIATYLLRNIPAKIFRFSKRHTTTSIEITSQNNI